MKWLSYLCKHTFIRLIPQRNHVNLHQDDILFFDKSAILCILDTIILQL